MSSLLGCFLISSFVFVALLPSSADGCGFPMMAAAPPPMCCCGGGGGGGCGRKKREVAAVQPHFKGSEVPCPQSAWRPILEQEMAATELDASLAAIQAALYRRYPDQRFLVHCSDSAAEPGKLHFSSSGDGYCGVAKEHLWCQAIAISA